MHRHYLSSGEGLSVLTTDFIYTPDDGLRIGNHNGAHYYTVGQRKGLNIGGKAEPIFVLKPDTVKNNLYVVWGMAIRGLTDGAFSFPIKTFTGYDMIVNSIPDNLTCFL